MVGDETGSGEGLVDDATSGDETDGGFEARAVRNGRLLEELAGGLGDAVPAEVLEQVHADRQDERAHARAQNRKEVYGILSAFTAGSDYDAASQALLGSAHAQNLNAVNREDGDDVYATPDELDGFGDFGTADNPHFGYTWDDVPRVSDNQYSALTQLDAAPADASYEAVVGALTAVYEDVSTARGKAREIVNARDALNETLKETVR